MQVECKLQFKGIKDNIMKAVEYMQMLLDELEVRRIFMKSSEIKVIISNLMPIKQQIHPSEIRCCRDNALRDINHPFYTIYYKNKEVAFVGTAEELDKSIALVESEISREKQIKKNIFSINYLIPVCEKYNLVKIKERIERDYSHTKLIIYDPLLPRKNVSITLSSNYVNFDKAYNDLKTEIDALKLFSETFENYQKSAVYQMCKYFFKYLQNFFQTHSTIFMKAWDTITLDFLVSDPLKNSLFEKVKYNFSKDHELKFYIMSVTKMPIYPGANPSRLGLTKGTLVQIVKTVLNKQILFDPTLFSKNFQSIFNFTPMMPEEQKLVDSKFEFENISSFLAYYNPKRYSEKLKNHYGSEFESLDEEIQSRIMTQEELENEKRESRREKERRDEMSTAGFNNRFTKFTPKDERIGRLSRNSSESVRGSPRQPRGKIARKRSSSSSSVSRKREKDKEKEKDRERLFEKEKFDRDKERVDKEREKEKEKEREREKERDRDPRDPRKRFDTKRSNSRPRFRKQEIFTKKQIVESPVTSSPSKNYNRVNLS